MSTPAACNVNPHRKEPRPLVHLDQNRAMGPQSQRRLTLEGRTHQMQANSHNKKRKAGQQLALHGGVAFDSDRDCEVCKGRLAGRNVHRGHHKLCTNNRKTKGITSEATLKQMKIDDKLKKLFATPFAVEEKASSQCLTKEAGEAFFAARNLPKTIAKTNNTASTTAMTTTKPTPNFTAESFCEAAMEKTNHKLFVESHANGRAPLPMLAFASVVVDKIVPDKTKIFEHFNNLTMHVPPTKDMHNNPHCHSVVGQKLLLVDWIKLCGLDVKCPGCDGANLVNDRTNFSKNKLLFPIFEIDGPPSWCMIMSMTCPCCWRQHWANDGQMLTRLPAFATTSCPVETKCALSTKNCRICRGTTDVCGILMTTYGNGDLCSRLLCNAIDRACLERVTSCHSRGKHFAGIVGPFLSGCC